MPHLIIGFNLLGPVWYPEIFVFLNFSPRCLYLCVSLSVSCLRFCRATDNVPSFILWYFLLEVDSLVWLLVSLVCFGRTLDPDHYIMHGHRCKASCMWSFFNVCLNSHLWFMLGARGSIVGWGTMLQAGRARVRFPRSLDFLIDRIA
jgi:hypothetical protein